MLHSAVWLPYRLGCSPITVLLRTGRIFRTTFFPNHLPVLTIRPPVRLASQLSAQFSLMLKECDRLSVHQLNWDRSRQAMKIEVLWVARYFNDDEDKLLHGLFLWRSQ